MSRDNVVEAKKGSCAEMQDGVIICPTCHHQIENLTVWRCPRCNASLIKLGCNGDCKKCGT